MFQHRKLSTIQRLRSFHESVISDSGKDEEHTFSSSRNSLVSAFSNPTLVTDSTQTPCEKKDSKFCKVQFKHNFRICSLPVTLSEVEVGEFVIVESFVNKRNEDLGIVVETYKSLPEQVQDKVGLVLHIASASEKRRLPLKIEKEFCLLMTCHRFVESHMLPMDIQSVELQFDENVLFVYYTSKHRVDGRSLVKFLLKSHCKTQVEMRKIDENNFTPYHFVSYCLCTGNYHTEKTPTEMCI